MRIKAKLKDDVATIKLLIKHSMESGRRKDEAGNVIPANYVQTVTAHIAGTQVFEVNSGVGVSKNPFLQFILSGRSVGDTIDLKWIDSSGESEENSVTLK
ncbi:MAG: thiosulfate oxidation carrier complex protein SoxZ [Alcanivoracaceae bacterium]|nr:thiosulfate oxidation carrier complex protein SoxZ [Alcanivoracaceae bacterium]